MKTSLVDNELRIHKKDEIIGLFTSGDKKTAVKKLLLYKEDFPDYKDEIILISIITPSFNSTKYIEETIQSVIKQTYLYVEHIIQDGNSTDGTRLILEKYNNYLNWASEPDKGESDGLNKAIQRANGDVLLVLNADDVLLPGSCSLAIQQFNKNPEVAVIYGNQYMINANSKIFCERIPLEYDFVKELCVENVIPAQTAFIQRKFFENVGLYADVSLPVVPDYEMWLRIGLHYPLKYVPEFICKYRVHDGQQTGHIDKIIETRKTIMNRIFTNPTYSNFHPYKERAYSGNLHWGAVQHFINKNKNAAIKKLMEAYTLNPELRKEKPLISIITIIDKPERFLENAIQSVLKQSYLYIEHIVTVVNLDSYTQQVLKDYENQINLNNSESQNLPDALNKAIKECNGDIVYILNSQDELHPNACWWAMHHFTHFPDNFIIFGDRYFISDESKIISKKRAAGLYKKKRVFCFEDDIPLQSSFINKHYIEKSGFYFDTAFEHSFYYNFILKIDEKYKIRYYKNYVCGCRKPNLNPIDEALLSSIYEENKIIMTRNLVKFQNSNFIKNRALAGLHFWFAKQLLSNKFYKKGLKLYLISVSNPFTIFQFLENIFLRFWWIIPYVRHAIYLLILRPTLSFRKKIGLTKEQVNELLYSLLNRSK